MIGLTVHGSDSGAGGGATAAGFGGHSTARPVLVSTQDKRHVSKIVLILPYFLTHHPHEAE